MDVDVNPNKQTKWQCNFQFTLCICDKAWLFLLQRCISWYQCLSCLLVLDHGILETHMEAVISNCWLHTTQVGRKLLKTYRTFAINWTTLKIWATNVIGAFITCRICYVISNFLDFLLIILWALVAKQYNVLFAQYYFQICLW